MLQPLQRGEVAASRKLQCSSVSRAQTRISLVWSMLRAKRSRHDDLERLVSLKARPPFVSQSALGALLRLAKEEELPDIASRNVVREARDKYVQLNTPYGPVHRHLDLGGGIQAESQTPYGNALCCVLEGQRFR